jgi:hypothetical protein
MLAYGRYRDMHQIGLTHCIGGHPYGEKRGEKRGKRPWMPNKYKGMVTHWNLPNELV